MEENNENEIVASAEEKPTWSSLYGKPIMAWLAFLVAQMAVTAIVLIATIIKNGKMAVDLPPVGSLLALWGSSILTVAIMLWMLKMFSFPRDFKPSGISLTYVIVAIVGAMIGSLSFNIIVNFLHLPDLLKADMTEIVQMSAGAFYVAIFGPVVEEIVFRAGILGHMLRKGVSPFKAILIAALLFGLMHINPPQVIFATLFALLLGVIYYKTRNIILTSVIHILNNSLAVAVNLLGAADTEQDTQFPLPLLFVAIVLAAITAFAYSKLWKASDITQ